MTREQRSRADRMKQIQDEASLLSREIAQDFLDAQVELIRRCTEIQEAKGVVPDGLREHARTMITTIESLFETSGQISFKTLGMEIPTVKETITPPDQDLEIPYMAQPHGQRQ